jgi:signal transduction histidine kinase
LGSAAGSVDCLSRDVSSIRVHEHVCAAFDAAPAEIRAAKMFLEAGLKRGERCVYFAENRQSPRELEDVFEELKHSGRTNKAGALVLLPYPGESKNLGNFEPARMLEVLQQLVSAAEADGFPAICIAIDMGGMASSDHDCGRLVDYENKLNHFFRRSLASGFCHYRRNRFHPSALKQCILRHPLVLHENVVCHNYWFIPPHRSDAAAAEMECLLEQLLEHHRHHIDLQSMQAQRALLASAGHELRNPMQALDNVLFLLRQKTHDVEVQRYVTVAQQELQQMKQVATHTLNLGRDSDRPSTFKLAEMLDAILAFYNRKVEHKQIQVHRRYDSDGSIRALSGPLRQVFTNLIVNALEAMPSAGELIVHLYESRDWTRPDRRGFRIAIADNGSGIAAYQKGKVFEAFFTTKGEHGSGLGLWVSRGIAERHGGTIRLRSSQGPARSGTVFSVFLPKSALVPVSTN